MDAIDLLRHQHTEVRELFLRVDGGAGQTRRAYFLRLAKVLTVHARLEEEQFYVAMRRAETVDLLRDSEAEHSRVKALLTLMARMNPDSRQFLAYLAELRAAVDAHILEEEAVLFPKSERSLGREGLAVLGEVMAERLEELEQPGGTETFSAQAELAQA